MSKTTESSFDRGAKTVKIFSMWFWHNIKKQSCFHSTVGLRKIMVNKCQCENQATNFLPQLDFKCVNMIAQHQSKHILSVEVETQIQDYYISDRAFYY